MNNNFFELKGQTLLAIELYGPDECEITTDKNKYRLIHHQDCCESVSLEKQIGEISNLIGEKITLAEEEYVNDDPDWYEKPEYREDSFTWSNYYLEAGGHRLELYFLGESNGYYCETMEFEKL